MLTKAYAFQAPPLLRRFAYLPLSTASTDNAISCRNYRILLPLLPRLPDGSIHSPYRSPEWVRWVMRAIVTSKMVCVLPPLLFVRPHAPWLITVVLKVTSSLPCADFYCSAWTPCVSGTGPLDLACPSTPTRGSSPPLLRPWTWLL
jgi:hypothetical protein